MSWSPQQDAALMAVKNWQRHGYQQVYKLFGYAGTGKTTLAQQIARDTFGTTLFAAFTGKATQVLKQKGCSNATTLHSLIYRLDKENNGSPTWKKNSLSDLRNASLLIVDECSMVDQELAQDILSFGKKVLVLGDPGQLPPVSGEGFFTRGQPDFLLTEIHRQARDNPIIRLASDIRQGKRWGVGDYGAVKVIKSGDLNYDVIAGADQALCGRNKTRINNNLEMRSLQRLSHPFPVAGERLVCLRNNKERGLLNGSLWRVADWGSRELDRSVKMMVKPEDGGAPIMVTTRKEFFMQADPKLDWQILKATDQFTYGYFLTVHKSQGSQWNGVVLLDESFAFREAANNWLYTGVTRAAERLTMVVH